MAKVELNHMFISASGKLCSKEGTYLSYNRQTGKVYQAEYNTHTVQPNTEAQQEIKATFTSKAKAASAWWEANKPSTQNPDGTDDYKLLMQKYKAQRKIGNPYSYLRTLVQDDMTIDLGSSSTTQASSTGDTLAGTTTGGTTTGGTTQGDTNTGGDDSSDYN